MKRRSVLPGRTLKRFTDCGAEINCPATSRDETQLFFQLPKESVFKPSPCQDTKPFSGTPRSVGVTTGKCGHFPNGFLLKRHRNRKPSSTDNSRYGKEERETCTRTKRLWGGSDPTLCGFQPPKISWDRSRPLAPFARSRLGRVHRSKHKFRNASCTTNFNRKGAR